MSWSSHAEIQYTLNETAWLDGFNRLIEGAKVCAWRVCDGWCDWQSCRARLTSRVQWRRRAV